MQIRILIRILVMRRKNDTLLIFYMASSKNGFLCFSVILLAVSMFCLLGYGMPMVKLSDFKLQQCHFCFLVLLFVSGFVCQWFCFSVLLFVSAAMYNLFLIHRNYQYPITPQDGSDVDVAKGAEVRNLVLLFKSKSKSKSKA